MSTDRTTEARRATGGAHMLHLVTRLTAPVAAFVGPATATLAAQGLAQTLVAWDDETGRALQERLDPRVQVRWVPAGRGRAAALAGMRTAAAEVLAADDGRPVLGVHAHGVQAALVAATLPAAVRGRTVYFSPHASRLLGGAVPLGRPVLQAVGGRLGLTAIAADDTEVQRLPAGTAPRRVEAPVERRWFALARHEGAQPLVVGSAAAEAGDAPLVAFVRLAVLLSDGRTGPRFAWVGEASSDGLARLKAAGVRRIAPHDDDALAEALAEAWVHVAMGGGRGLPTVLARAMAAGVPILADDTPVHRTLVVHGRSGLLGATDDARLGQLAALLDRADWRALLGRGAADIAGHRLDPDDFARRLLDAYRQPPRAAAAATTEIADTAGATA